jgi:hypothetical protein
VVVAPLALLQCAKTADKATASGSGGASTGSTTGGAPDAGADAKWPGYDPYTVTPASALSAPRDFALHRGTIHLHSVYSWDADDQLGFIDDAGVQDYDAGAINEPYYQDLRKGLCNTAQEFAFLTDHRDYYPNFEYPDVLLYRESMGDQLILQNGSPVAVELACPGGPPVLLQAGCDYNTIAMGLDQHVAATPAERLAALQTTPQAFATIRQNGALVLAGYLPRWTISDLLANTWDGLENYNPIFNFDDRIGDALSLVLALQNAPSTVPVPELGIIGIFEENTTILTDWSQMAQKARVPSFIGSNAHENVLPTITYDGERLDSYRRMLHWWSNYVMLPKGTTISTSVLKQAIAAGHTFASFDYLGYPTGFDFHAETGGMVYEQGDQIPAGTATTNLVVVAPTVYGLKPIDQVPQITVRILQATGTTWTEVASGTGTVTATNVSTGVYRAEARIVPNHLTPNLGSSPSQYLTEKLWIYGNTIWVGTGF